LTVVVELLLGSLPPAPLLVVKAADVVVLDTTFVLGLVLVVATAVVLLLDEVILVLPLLTEAGPALAAGGEAIELVVVTERGPPTVIASSCGFGLASRPDWSVPPLGVTSS